MDVTEDGINFVYIIIILPETRRTETAPHTTVQASARRMAMVPVPRSIWPRNFLSSPLLVVLVFQVIDISTKTRTPSPPTTSSGSQAGPVWRYSSPFPLLLYALEKEK